ncbi:MAG: DUF962 domain-containing protein [Gammaproteobacteria bacterium]|nr:DUF962 domain-containing protein [Gammaproteobacteria bacterium]
MAREFSGFREFYPYYLSEHRNPNCRRMHFAGTLLVIATAVYAVFSGKLRLLWLLPVLGYGFAWVGHAVFEKNRPATFTHPIYSLIGDFLMFAQLLTGRIRFRP